jgi:hypothetical protein
LGVCCPKRTCFQWLCTLSSVQTRGTMSLNRLRNFGRSGAGDNRDLSWPSPCWFDSRRSANRCPLGSGGANGPTIAGPSPPSWTCLAECCTERYPFFKGRSLATKYQLPLLLSDDRLIADCSEEETSHRDCDHDHAKLADAEGAQYSRKCLSLHWRSGFRAATARERSPQSEFPNRSNIS